MDHHKCPRTNLANSPCPRGYKLGDSFPTAKRGTGFSAKGTVGLISDLNHADVNPRVYQLFKTVLGISIECL